MLDRKRKHAWIALWSCVGFGWLMTLLFVNPACWGYGHAVEILDASWDERGIVLLDYRESGGDETSEPTPYYRLHMIGADGGKRHRVLIGAYAETGWIDGDSMVCRIDTGRYEVISRESGKRLAVIDHANLAASWDELRAGVAESRMDGRVRRIDLLAKDGRRWYLDPVANRLDPANVGSPVDAKPRWSFDDSTIRFAPRERESVNLLWLEPVGGAESRKRLVAYGARSASVSIDESGDVAEFLQGKIIAAWVRDLGADETKASVTGWGLVEHWTTLDREEFSVTCSGIAGRIAWTRTQKDLFGRVGTGTPRAVASPDGTMVLVCWAERAVALDAETGETIWSLVP
jgi:hypothetical protein